MHEPEARPESESTPPCSDPGALPLERWEGCTAAELAATWGVPKVHLFASVGSTNDVARNFAEAGAAAGTIVLAEEQSQGRGRAGRGWVSPAGVGLWISMIARPTRPEEMPTLPLRTAAAVATALDPFLLEETIGIKWPNDLLIHGRKLAGILCEGAWSGPQLGYVIIGIGVNLLHSTQDFPPSLREQAISLRIATGAPISRFEAGSAVVGGLQNAASGLDWQSTLPLQLERRDALRNRPVQITEPLAGTEIAIGIARGIDAEGALLVETEGAVRAIRSGTVRMLAPDVRVS